MFSRDPSSDGVGGMASRPGTGNLGGSERTKAVGRVGINGACAEKHGELLRVYLPEVGVRAALGPLPLCRGLRWLCRLCAHFNEARL